jgi:type III restriction enzyme
MCVGHAHARVSMRETQGEQVPTQLQFKFDANQPHQLHAVESIVRLFEGMSRTESAFRLGDDVVCNLPPGDDLSEQLLFDNLIAVQQANNLPQAPAVALDAGLGLPGVSDASHSYPHFTIEMETGTGKTYVYLRTIYELRRRFGFSKFIVVVPSIAIFEGVAKSVEITRSHLRALYDNEPFDLIPYDGGQLSRLRTFSSANTVTVLLITLAAFNSVTNNIYKASEKLPGERRPFQYVQGTRPILILDEPQNMESERSKQALRTLRPLLALRFSATHRSSPNLVYQLTPFDAYQADLVKRIQVFGVTERDSANLPILSLTGITRSPRLSAEVHTRVTDMLGTREADITLHQGDDLFSKTNRAEYRGDFIVENIHAGAGLLEFRNGVTLSLHETAATAFRPAVFREQIRQTIQQHFEMQRRLMPRAIKVISLFFIDRVANYTAADGIIRQLFDDEYEKLQDTYDFYKPFSAAQVRNAYFAKKKLKDGSEEAIDTDSSNVAEREAEKQAFQLIMRDKAQLLSFGEPVCFIFAHSALREGWDSPNVFQICTLRSVGGEIERRQQIGRGLRLAVNQSGDRVHDDGVNLLTVIANEAYADYARGLQQEYVADGVAPPPLPSNGHAPRDAQRNDAIFLQEPLFQEFWQRINRRLRYRISVDTPQLITDCLNRLNKAEFPAHVLVVDKGKIVLGAFKIRAANVSAAKARLTFSLFDQEGEPIEITQTFRPGDDASRKIDPRLRPLGTLSMVQDAGVWYAAFADVRLRIADGDEAQYTPEGFGGEVRDRAVQVRPERFPVFNLIERAAQATGLTRPTINTIFQRMRGDFKRRILDNPEGFAGVFIGALRNALADHITERIAFVEQTDAPPYDLAEMFPQTRAFPQREVVDAGPRGLYDLVQMDSDVERRYIDAIKREGDAIVFYFKFPSGFKVDLPALIGDYNPDWGIARIHRNGEMQVRSFVHETKGTTRIERLRFPHEKRKLRCAQTYFAQLGITYRPIDPTQTSGWWEASGEMALPVSP